MDVLLALLFGLAGGAVGGLLGVGGGVLFVPALVLFLDQSQLGAEATSLLAIVPVAALGTWRQHRNGNVEVRAAVTIGLLSVPGVALGVVVANTVPERALELGFSALILLVALQLLRRGLRPPNQTFVGSASPSSGKRAERPESAPGDG